MKSTRRNQLYKNTREEIKSIAWKQMAENGVASLSLGAIARELGVTTPALYRYFPARNDLVTALIVDAYASFNETLQTARDRLPSGDHIGRFRSLFLTYYAWALAHPQQYLLIFGTPVRGYQMDPAVGALADQSFEILLDMVNAAARDSRISFSFRGRHLSIEMKKQLERIPSNGRSYPARVMYLALVSWSFIHGVTSLELTRRYAAMLENKTDQFVQMEADRFMKYIGLD